MKKVLILVVALVLAMSLLCSAVAETRTYAMTEIDDAEGNILYAVSDDGTQVLDADGNDVTADYPILVFVCDDEAMEGAWASDGIADDAVACTLTEEAAEDGTVVITATFEDGSTITPLVYSQEDDAFVYTNGDYLFVLTNIG